MFLLVNLLSTEDASLTSLQTEAFCLQNRYKTSCGRERVSATHTACSDQRDHPKRERTVRSLASLPTAAAREPSSALCRASFRRSGAWALLASLKLTVHLASLSTGCYWQLLQRVSGMAILVSTIWGTQAISSYSISHHSLSSLCSSTSTNRPSILLWIRGSLSKQSQRCFILPSKLTSCLSPPYQNLCPFFSFPVGTLLSCQFCHSSGIPTGQQGLSWLWAVNSWPTPSLFFSESHARTFLHF